ncbi:MAG: hypothetical protein LHW64_10320 [Candidatus Cloacimonetes bacterium]|nr:hypothetical protein [Candidatus Cloacimonadota bacterium]MDY0230505.1 hypothetical protein [Candidatus Cloacimonadaceae bacterium]
MADSLKMVLSIDTRAAKESLKLIRDYFGDLRNLLKDPAEYEIATKAAEAKLDGLEAQMDALSDVEVSIDADSSGAEAAAGDAEGAIEEIPEEHHTEFSGDGGGLDGIIGQLRSGFDGLISGLARYGLAMNAVVQGYGMLKAAMGGLISASNTQEMAEGRLTASLTQRGLATEQHINKLKAMASEVQGLTTVGDEASLELMNTAVNMGVGFDDLGESLEGAIGLSKAFSGAGLNMETAIKGIALAREGEFSQLQRYIPALRSAQTETEKMTILKEAMANGFELAKAEAETGAGALEQYKNAVGDLYELLGSLIKVVLIPLAQSLKKAVEWIQKNKDLILALGASVLAYIGYLVILNIKLIVLTAQQVAYNVQMAVGNALMGNFAGIALAAAAAAGIYALSIKKSGDAARDANGAVKAHNLSLSFQAGKLKEVRQEAEAYAKSLDYVSAKEELKELNAELEKLYEARPGLPNDPLDGEKFDEQMQQLGEFQNKRAELSIRISAIEGEIRDRDLNAVRDFYAEKERLDTEASLNGLELSRYRLERAEAEYKALGALDANNVDKKQQLYAQMAQYRKEVAETEAAIGNAASEFITQTNQAEEADLRASLERKKLDLVQYYANMSELSGINYEGMVADFEEYLEELGNLYGEDSEEYRKAQNELSNIQRATHMRMIQEKGTFASRIAAMERDKNLQILADRERLLEEAKRLYGEDSEEYLRYAQIITQHSADKAMQRYDIQEESLAAQLSAAEEYFAAHMEMLLEAGYSEEQIVQAQEDAKARIRKAGMLKELADGQQMLNGVSGIYANLGKAISGESEKSFKTRKALSIVQGMIDTYSGALAAYASMAKFGPVLAGVAAAAAVAAGLANVENIRKQEYVPPKAAEGGLLEGRSHAEGGAIIEAEGGEFVTKKSRVKELGAGIFNFLNSAPLAQVKEALGRVSFPEIPIPTLPKMVYAEGGVVSLQGANTDLLQEIRWLRRDLQDKEFVNVVYIDPNDVIDKADDSLVNQKNLSGAVKRGGARV